MDPKSAVGGPKPISRTGLTGLLVTRVTYRVLFLKVPPTKELSIELVPLNSVLSDFILLRETNSILRTFLGGTFRKKTPCMMNM